MKTNNKLLSFLKACVFCFLLVLAPSVYAEYYFAAYGPTEPCCATTIVKRVYVTRPHRIHHHRHYVRHRQYVDGCRDVDSCGQVIPRRRPSSFSVTVSSACPSFGCCGTPFCDGGVVTQTFSSRTYYDGNVDYNEPCYYSDSCQSQSSVTYYYGNDFDYDRRTADDVGADMNIDY